MTSNEWKKCKLFEIAEFNPIETIKKGQLAKKIAMEKLIPYCKQIPSFERCKYNGGTKFRNGDTIMARITPCLENGKISKVTILNDNEIGFGSTEYIVFRAIENLSNPDFLYYLIISSLVREPAIKSMVGSSGRQRVQIDVVKNIEIGIPPLETQQKIAKVLSVIDDKIELNNSINNNLEQQAQAIFKSWFVDFEPFNGIIPDDWSEDILGNFIEIKRGGSPRPIQDYIADSGYRWLKISDATSIQSPFILNIKEHIKESGINKTVLLKSGSLVLSNSATPGIPKILDVDSCIHDGWLYFPKSMLSNEYLYLLFKFIRPNLVALGNGSVFTNLKTDILRNYNTILPDKEILTKFDGVVSVIFKQILYNTRENEKLIQLRDTLLPKLMSGEIDVSKVEIDNILENQSADKLLFSEDK